MTALPTAFPLAVSLVRATFGYSVTGGGSPSGDTLVTEDGDALTTEAGDDLVTE